MKKECEVRPYQSGDEEGIVELLELVFDGWPHFDLDYSPLNHWKWKHQDNSLKMNAIALGVSNNIIVGCLHCTYRRIKIGEKNLLCSQGVDLVVHPDYRRLGVYTKMFALKDELLSEDNVNLHYSATGIPLLMKRAIKIGLIRFPHPLLNLVRIHDIDLHVKMMQTEHRLIKKYGYYFIKTVNKIGNVFNRPLKSTSKFSIIEIDHFDDRIDNFWDKVKNHYDFILERKKSYLNWRYCDQRGGDYIVNQVEEEGCIIGYSVLRINMYKEDYPLGYIVDLLTLPGRLDVVEALIKDAIRYFDDLAVNIVQNCVVKNHPYERLFKRNGFLNSRLNLFFSYNPIRVESEIDEFQKAPANRLYFQYGDIDWI